MLQFSQFAWTLRFSSLTIFSLQMQQIEVILVAIKSAFYRIKHITPFIFREHSL